jgi:hypothetical protein
MRVRASLAILLLASVACSNPDRDRRTAGAAGPTGVSVIDSPMATVGVSGPMDVKFPSRAETFEFRNQLETKYQTGLNRSASSTFVDREGEVVWLQEYIRYRVNGCDHTTAIQRVMAQIDGGAPGGICAENRDFVVVFPPRNETMDFRRQLETKYQSMGRGLQQTFVDMEGSVIWTQEYLRYRTNECDHATATQKVFAQIDGGPVSATCVPDCRYRVAPADRELDGGQQNNFVDLVGEPGGCAWTASSDASWLTFSSDYTSGTNGVSIPYTVMQNVSGGARTGRIRFAWQGGGTSHTIYQSGSAAITSFVMADTFRSGNSPTTECHFRAGGSGSPCTFTATSNLPGGGAYTYNWTATYFYGTQKTVTQLGSSNQFTISDVCGGDGSSPTGNSGDLSVTLTVTDSLGNTQTIRSGDGMQPALTIWRFSC